MTPEQPSPLPWRYQEGSDAYTHIIRSGGRFICQLPQDSSGRAEADARLIVRAVNSYAAFVETLDDAPVLIVDIKAARLRGEDEAVEYARKLADWAPRAKAALALAREGQK